jgi:signal transduction histidine kinase
MQNLMMDLLDLAQMDQNQFKLNKKFFSIYDVFNGAISIVSHYAEEKRVQLNVPPALDPGFLRVFGDQHRFQQVIVNILSNSLKYSNTDSKINIDLILQESRIIESNDIFLLQNLSDADRDAIFKPAESDEG